MIDKKKIAIIGGGPSAVFLLKHFLDHISEMKIFIASITVYERGAYLGMGMPYSPDISDEHNMANIPSEEMPALLTTFGDWLRGLDDVALASLRIERARINDRKIYSRIALGKYLKNQYEAIVCSLEEQGLEIIERVNCNILDLKDDGVRRLTTVLAEKLGVTDYDQVIIATGHSWPHNDRPEAGYFSSPWPIAKLLPKEGFYNFPIGTLGASLSAFDVIASLAVRHGEYVDDAKGGIIYQPFAGTEKFKLVMHAGHGRLPHLRYDIEELERKIYQDVSMEEISALLDGDGFLRIDTYFDKICRPLLREAFEKDGLLEIANLLKDADFSFERFVRKMSEEHSYPNAFEGMRYEMVEAKESVLGHKPIHWKELIDDLVYTLNFHAELMPAEDHIFLHGVVLPFLMNVIAAMPLHSADKLLALYDAGKIEIISGKTSLAENQPEAGRTTIEVSEESGSREIHYRMFVDCSGQKPLEIEDFPFPGLVREGVVRKARARFGSVKKADDLTGSKAERLDKESGEVIYYTGGIDIDGTYRVINQQGRSNPRILDIAFPHTSGIRPYSYGLQSCSDTGEIVTRALIKHFQDGGGLVGTSQEEIAEIYDNV